jgi:hypothetical protein
MGLDIRIYRPWEIELVMQLDKYDAEALRQV